MRQNSKLKDVCIYKIGIPEHQFHSGELILRFNTLKNINVYVNYG